LCIGSATEEVNSDGDVHLPDEICVPYTGGDNDLDALIECIFPRPMKTCQTKTTSLQEPFCLHRMTRWI
jgi:hypothetical protein